MNGARWKPRPHLPENERSVQDVMSGDFVRDVHQVSIFGDAQYDALHDRNEVVLRAIVCHERDDGQDRAPRGLVHPSALRHVHFIRDRLV